MKYILRYYWLTALLSVNLAEAQPDVTRPLPLSVAENGHYYLAEGHYRGNFRISSPATIECHKHAIIDGMGQGNALLIDAENVSLNGCTLRNAGSNLTDMNAAVFVTARSHNTTIRQNHIRGKGFGIWVDGARQVKLLDNTIRGDDSVRSQDRGNGIHLYAVQNALVQGNRIEKTRDGIYIDTSNHNHLDNNVISDLRYGIHYMFSNNNRVTNNHTRNTRTGYALMQSRKLTVTGNTSENDQNYGILMNYITYSTLQHNNVSGVRSGSSGNNQIDGAEGKALFIYNSVFNEISANHFSNSSLGIHLTAGSEDNKIFSNAFINNEQQVKYVATRTQEWSDKGRGNYWSDYLGWDRNADDIGDISYEPNDNIDRLIWMYPQMRLLLNSPAIELLRWVQQAFPVVKSPGVKDSFPLMTPALTEAP